MNLDDFSSATLRLKDDLKAKREASIPLPFKKDN